MTPLPQHDSNSGPTPWHRAPLEHVVQFYDRDSVLLDSLCGFVSAGLLAGESAIIIATKEHIQALDDR
jgi:hypothetical protein